MKGRHWGEDTRNDMERLARGARMVHVYICGGWDAQGKMVQKCRGLVSGDDESARSGPPRLRTGNSFAVWDASCVISWAGRRRRW